MTDVAPAADQPYVWLRTTGRRSGRPHTVELWFVVDGHTVYFLAGGGQRTDWVRNSAAEPRVSVRLGAATIRGVARRPDPGGDEELRARERMAAKYQGWRPGLPLSSWAAQAVCVAVDLENPR